MVSEYSERDLLSAGESVLVVTPVRERERRAGASGAGAGETEQKEGRIDVNVNRGRIFKAKCENI